MFLILKISGLTIKTILLEVLALKVSASCTADWSKAPVADKTCESRSVYQLHRSRPRDNIVVLRKVRQLRFRSLSLHRRNEEDVGQAVMLEGAAPLANNLEVIAVQVPVTRTNPSRLYSHKGQDVVGCIVVDEHRDPRESGRLSFVALDKPIHSPHCSEPVAPDTAFRLETMSLQCTDIPIETLAVESTIMP